MFFNTLSKKLSDRFNRYMVECESLLMKTVLIRLIVLIDTWWNVNATEVWKATPGDAVLIDTWWNVNQ